MRAVFSILGLLIVVAIVGLLARKQLGSTAAPPLVPALPGASAPAGTAQQQSQQIQQQMKQAVEGTMQQPRPMPEEK